MAERFKSVLFKPKLTTHTPTHPPIHFPHSPILLPLNRLWLFTASGKLLQTHMFVLLKGLVNPGIIR